MEKEWHLYMVRCRDNSLYTGISYDVKRRVNEHNGVNGSKLGAKYTKRRKPCFLVYIEKLNTDSKSIAMKREYKVKHLKKKDKEALILSKSNIINNY